VISALPAEAMETPFSDSKRNGVQAVRRAVNLLEALAKTRRSAPLGELSRRVGLNKSTAYQLLATLQALGLVEKDRESRSYRLGPKMLELATSFLDGSDLIAKFQPILQDMRNRINETATLHLLVGDHRVMAAKAESSHPIRLSANVGEASSLMRGAGGKAIIAFMEPARIESLLAQAVKDRRLKKTEIAGLLKDLKEIRAKGFSMSKGEHIPGAFGISVPLFNAEGEVIASLGLSGPLERCSFSLRDNAIAILKEYTTGFYSRWGFGRARKLGMLY